MFIRGPSNVIFDKTHFRVIDREISYKWGFLHKHVPPGCWAEYVTVAYNPAYGHLYKLQFSL